MLGNGGIIGRAIVAEHSLVDLLFAKCLPGVQGKKLADGILGLGKRQCCAADCRRFGRQIKADAAAHQPMLRGTVLPPQVGIDTGAQLSKAERFDEVVIGPDAEPGQDGWLVGAGGQEQNGCFCLGADAAADGKAILAGHHDVQQNAVCPAAERAGDIGTRAAGLNRMAVPLKCCF